MGIFLVTTSLLLIVGLFFFSRGGGFSFPWVQFYVKGKESGFSIHELNLLRRVALENQLKNPTSLFWSEKTLDRCIRGTIVRFRAQDKENSEQSVQFLGKLFDFRRRVELNLPKYRLGLRSSRNVSQGQLLKLTFPGASGAYTSTVVENMRKYLAISYPKGKSSPTGFSWQGQRVNVYFWRQEDAGYYFETKVIGDYLERKFPILHISHADQLVRTQKRNSVRAELKGPGYLYPLKTIEQANENLEKSGGYRCRMVDLSEDGAAILVGGKAKPGMPVKIQTEVNGQPVVMCGVVKGVTFKQKNNASILHIQAKLPSRSMRNVILTYVYSIFRDGNTNSAQISSLRTKDPTRPVQDGAVAT